MIRKYFLDIFIALLGTGSAYQIYKQEQSSMIKYLQLSPYLILLIATILLCSTYFLFLRKKTMFECMSLWRSVRKNHLWIPIVLLILFGGAFILSLRFEQRFEYVQMGKMQVLTPFMQDRWNGSIFWIAPPKKPNYKNKVNNKNWERFPLTKFDQDIYGVWHPKFDM